MKSRADRLEVCQDLSVGGLTPSMDLVQDIIENVDVPISILIRPHANSFLYNDDDVNCMLNSINSMNKIGVKGFVFGALTKEGTIDVAVCRKLLDAAKGFDVTFHRAFDVIEDKKKALEVLSQLKFKRILTAGGTSTAQEGKDKLKELIEQANGRIAVMPGGGVNKNNIEEIVDYTKCREIHSSGRTNSSICLVKNIKSMKECLEKALYRRMLEYAAM